MANELKRQRRIAMGDADPTVAFQGNQPMPGMPQGPGNMMGNPQVGQSMGGGMPQPGRLDPNNPQSPYGDAVFTPDQYAQTGTVGFANNSGLNQNSVPGLKNNFQNYNSVEQPDETTSLMLPGMAMSEQAVMRAQRAYAATGDPTPSYQIQPMGIAGVPMDAALNGQFTPGQMSPQLPGNSNNVLAMQGNTTSQLPVNEPGSAENGNAPVLGLSTGRGGGRNQQNQNQLA